MVATGLLFNHPRDLILALVVSPWCTGRRENRRCCSLEAIRMLVRAAHGTVVA
jgi:hypothetical protein